LLLTLAVVNKSASVVGGRNNNAPPSASRNVTCNFRTDSTRMKMTTIIILTICLAIIAGLWYAKTKGQTKTGKIISQEKKTVYNKDEAEKFVKQLDELGYFKYANKADIDSLKENFIKEFDPTAELTSIWDDNTHLPNDFRYYFCDGEEVYEEGGIIRLLKDLKPVFHKMNFKCDITNHFEEWDEKNKWLNHKITINGSEYIILKNFKDYGWGEAPFRIAQILNIELKKQKIDEQIYLVNGGNDGRLALLSNAQFELIDKIYKDESWKPLEINRWAKVSKVDINKIDYWKE
jgi:hypothetical protein